MPDDSTLPAGCEILLLEDDALLRKRLAAHLRRLANPGREFTRLRAKCAA